MARDVTMANSASDFSRNLFGLNSCDPPVGDVEIKTDRELFTSIASSHVECFTEDFQRIQIARCVQWSRFKFEAQGNPV